VPGGRRKHRLRNWLIAGIVVVVVLAVGGPFVYVHFIEGPAPAKLTLPGDKTKTTGGSTVGTVTKGRVEQVNGTWNVGTGSVVGYRVGEVLIGQNSTAVGRTEKVWGSLTIGGGSVTKGSFTANMSSVTSDQSERNAQFDGRIMDVSTYPTAQFVVAKPISLGAGLEAGIVFADWDISNPSVGGFVTTQNSGTLEVLLHLVRGAGNPASTGATQSSGGSFGGPVTVPSTTVPPLTVPRS
jgi:YceI-like domain